MFSVFQIISRKIFLLVFFSVDILIKSNNSHIGTNTMDQQLFHPVYIYNLRNYNDLLSTYSDFINAKIPRGERKDLYEITIRKRTTFFLQNNTTQKLLNI